MTEANTNSKPLPVRSSPVRPRATPSAATRPLMSLLVILESLRHSEVMTASLKR